MHNQMPLSCRCALYAVLIQSLVGQKKDNAKLIQYWFLVKKYNMHHFSKKRGKLVQIWYICQTLICTNIVNLYFVKETFKLFLKSVPGTNQYCHLIKLKFLSQGLHIKFKLQLGRYM